MKKGLVVLFITVCVMTNFVFATSFTDLEMSHWAYEYINKLSNDGVINGYEDGTFKPNGTVTNAEFIKLVVATTLDTKLHVENANGKLLNWARDYVKIAENYEIIEEDEFNDENLNQPITRLNMARIVAKADTKMLNDEEIGNNKTDFSDVVGLSKEDKALLGYCVENKLIKGYEDNTFKPENNMTRAEAATMIYRFSSKNEDRPRITSVKQVEAVTSTPTPTKTKTLTPTSVPTKTPTKTPIPNKEETLRGDLNEDGKVTMEDAVLVFRFSAGMFSDEELAHFDAQKYDVDLNSYVNIGDGITLIKYWMDSTGFPLPEVSSEFAFQYGDVGGDGEISSGDVKLLEDVLLSGDYQIASGYDKLNYKVAYDIDEDGWVTSHDKGALEAYLAGDEKNLPNNPHKHEYTNGVCACGKEILYGDANGDGEVTISDTSKILVYWKSGGITSIDKIAADVNLDDMIDMTDYIIVMNYVKKEIDKLPHTEHVYVDGLCACGEEDPNFEVVLGDVNGDGNITLADATVLKAYVNGNDVTIIKRNSDVNEDGKIDEDDYTIIKAYSNSKIDKLPHTEHTFVDGICACGKEQ